MPKVEAEQGVERASAGLPARLRRVLLVPETLVFSLYAALTAVLTYPAITLVSRTYAEKRDPYILIWWTWWMKYAFQHNLALSPIPLASSPYGYRWSPYALDSLTYNVLRVLSIVFNETVAYNIFLLLCFFFTCVAAYFLVRHLTESRPAAAFGGLAFGLCPYMLMHGKEHINLMAVFALPLLALMLARAWERRTFPSVLLCGLVFVVGTAFSYQYGLLMALYAACFLFFIWLAGAPWRRSAARGRDRRRVLRLWLEVGAVLVLAVVAVGAMYAVLARSPQTGSRDISVLYQYSARPWDYVVPGPDGALLGWLSRDFVFEHLHGGFPVESTLFLGFSVIGLAVFALVAAGRQRDAPAASEAEGEPDDTDGANESQAPGIVPLREQPRRVVWTMTGTAVVAFLFSMPPSAKVLGVKLYFPGYLLHKVVPSFRAYARFGLIVMMCAVVLAAYGLQTLVSSWRARTAWLVTAGLCVLVIAEFTVVPPFRSLDTEATTDYYRWLAARPGQSTVAVYPWYSDGDFKTYSYLFEQRHHGKPLANGAQPGTQGALMRQVLLDPWDPDTPGLLARQGVRYVLIIPSLYNARDVRHLNYVYPRVVDDEALSRLPDGYRQVARFDDGIVYEVTAPPTGLYAVFNEGTIEGYFDSEGNLWHPVAGRIMVDVVNRRKEPVTADLSFTVRGTSGGETLEMYLDERRMGALRLQPGLNEVVLEDVTLKPGTNRLLLSSDGPPVQLTEVPGYEDVAVSMLVSNIHVE
ncbi:MAG: hypothetical protein KKF41_07515 [Actinobacteria bacterium]|nr:hypothetical protein [Actinomycetota bacterium]MBU1942233.1 hypothetical protein [Actinomycetota bacterium]MBU2687418.1 hypothetical protein [Actinomycetota bacterium]